jgi:hypothetical protein
MTAPSGLITRIWRIDLGVAQRFLDTERQPEKGVSGTNRKWSADVVNEYAFEMLAGRWGFSHEGFAFIGRLDTGTAEIKDGGQRCRALIQACTVGATVGGVTYEPRPDFAFDVMVTEGLDEDSWRIMNIGRRRSPGDFMYMEGEINGLLLASIIQTCYSYETLPPGSPFNREHWNKGKLSPTARKEYLDDNPGIREALHEGSRLVRVMNVSAVSAGYHLGRKAGISKEIMDGFIESMLTGAGDNWVKGNPILTFREMLSNAARLHRKFPREEQLALMIKVINAVVAGKEIKYLAYRTKKGSTGAQPEVFPRFTN